MNKKIRNFFLPLIIITSISFGFAFSSANYFEVSKNIDIFISLYKELHTYYVDDINSAKLMRTGIDEMLKTLDPYTVFISESEIEDYMVMTTGEYGGIGAVIGKKGKLIQVIEPYESYPAYEAGLRAGDIIHEVDGKSLEGKNTDQVSQLLKGQPGTDVKLIIERPGTEGMIEKKLQRKEIHVKNVPYSGMVRDGIGYISFTSFRQNSSEEVKKALLDLKKNEGLKGVILDLRNNPGGILTEAVKTVSWFVPQNELVVKTKGKLEEWDKDYNTFTPPVDLDIPIAVLVNENSASASEIVSGALQDLDRAVVVGRQTYGKGLVQQAKSLPYNSKIKLTIAKYYIPSGRCIQSIDYSHRDKNGKAIKVHDSLKTEFKTKSGRIVYDGAGILPDITVPERDYPKIIQSLLNKQLIFDYATRYRNEHEEIAKPEDFEVTDELYSDFIDFLKTRDYEYTTETEKELLELKESAEKEKYYSAISEEYNKLLMDLKENKKNDLLTFKKEIKDLLEEEIVGRYYYQTGRIITSLENDPEIDAAVNILTDADRYNKTLKRP